MKHWIMLLLAFLFDKFLMTDEEINAQIEREYDLTNRP